MIIVLFVIKLFYVVNNQYKEKSPSAGLILNGADTVNSGVLRTPAEEHGK